MKKITEIFVLAIASMVALSSCEKQNAINNENTVLKASFEDMTKTALGTEYQVLWSATDEIALFDSEGTRHISTSTTVSDGGLTAEFGFGGSVTSKIALFPADEEASCNEGGVVSTTLPTTQYPVAGGFDPKANIALSETVDNTAKFYNACTLIGFTIKNDDIKSITLRSDKALAGDCLIYMNSGVPEFSSHATDPSDLVLEADFENGKTYYAVVFPSEYVSFDVTFERADGKTATFENNNTLDLTSARSCITNFFDLEIPDSKWEAPTPKTWTYEVVQTSPTFAAGTPVTVNEATWSIVMGDIIGSPSTNGAPSKYSGIYGWKWGSSKSAYWSSYTLSTDFFNSKKVKSVTVNILNNGSKEGTLKVMQGSTIIGTTSYTFGTNWTDLTADTNMGTSGTLTIEYSVDQASYIHKITVQYYD